MSIAIAKAGLSDCDDIAMVNVRAFQATYKGIIDGQWLDNLADPENIRNKTDLFKRWIIEGRNEILAAKDNGRVIGFITAGDTRLYGFDIDKEIYGLYIDAGYHGQGIGRAMMEKMMGVLRQTGARRIGVGCLKANPSTGFYERIGGKVMEEVMWKYEKGELPEQVFLFEI